MEMNVMLTPLVFSFARKSALAGRRFKGRTEQLRRMEEGSMKAPTLRKPCSPLTLGLAALLLAACQTATPPARAQETGAISVQERVQRGKALFDEKCRTVAGERIYRTVPEVEGVLLLKVRPRVGDREWADRMWPGAAFAIEATGEDYLVTFLGYEEGGTRLGGIPSPITKDYRGSINTAHKPGSLPGYRYVDVIDEKDGKRYRYTGSEKVVGQKDITALGVRMALEKNPNYDLNVYRWTLDRFPTLDPAPRYAVTYEDHVVPEERALWLASSTVKVVDLQTGEVLGEMTRYAWSAGAPSSANPSPWLTAYKCPGHARGSDAATRKFVDQVLLPKKEK